MDDQNRADGAYENAVVGMGKRNDSLSHTRIAGLQVLGATELDALYANDGLAAKIIDKPADEMLRAGYCIDGVDDESDVLTVMQGLQADTNLANALRYARLYGGSLVVALINDGGKFEQPLNPDRIKSIEALRIYDRHSVSRHKLYSDPQDKRFGQVELYQVSPASGSPYMVHESRCFPVLGERVPPRVMEMLDGWGGSVIDRCLQQLERFGLAQFWGIKLIERAQQGVHGIPSLNEILTSPGGQELVRQRIDLVDTARGVTNTVIIDSQESYDLKSTSLSGVSDLIDRAGLVLSAVSGIPEAMLFGRQQAGLNSTGKSDMDTWYATIGQLQQTQLLPVLDWLVGLVIRSMGGDADDYLITFNPLSVPTEKEASETELNRARAAEIYVNAQALDPSEVRATLQQSGKYQMTETDIDRDEPEETEEDDDNGEENAIQSA